MSDVLASPDREELVAIARALSGQRVDPKNITFRTPVGDIQCRYMWSNVRLDEVTGDQMFFVKIRSSDMVFTPRRGAVMEVTTSPNKPAVSVLCLTAPLNMYPGIDLLCFMAHNPDMQKNGKLKEDAPSVVSGASSNAVVAGEPVVKGEKPATDGVAKMAALATKDFDNVRES